MQTRRSLLLPLALGPLLCAVALGQPRGPGAALAPLPEEIEVSIMKLTNIEWRPGARLPEWVSALDGRRVRVVGYMALDTHEGTSVFRQTWDQCGCATAKASHFIEVDLGDETTGYNPDEITVVGTMSVGEKEEDGFVTSLFRVRAESVR